MVHWYMVHGTWYIESLAAGLAHLLQLALVHDLHRVNLAALLVTASEHRMRTQRIEKSFSGRLGV